MRDTFKYDLSPELFRLQTRRRVPFPSQLLNKASHQSIFSWFTMHYSLPILMAAVSAVISSPIDTAKTSLAETSPANPLVVRQIPSYYCYEGTFTVCCPTEENNIIFMTECYLCKYRSFRSPRVYMKLFKQDLFKLTLELTVGERREPCNVWCCHFYNVGFSHWYFSKPLLIKAIRALFTGLELVCHPLRIHITISQFQTQVRLQLQLRIRLWP